MLENVQSIVVEDTSLPTLKYVDKSGKTPDDSGIQDIHRAHPTDAAFDVRSSADVCIGSGDWALISTGLYLDIPPGYEIQVRPRSGIAFKKGVTVLNSPGTIDEHYVDECKVILVNHSRNVFYVDRGDRIAQFVLSPIPKYNIEKVDRIDKASRGGGFGHSGIK